MDELITGIDNEGLEDIIYENPERFLRLPTKFEIHEYHIMEEFIWTLNAEKADKLNCVIQGGVRSGGSKIWLTEWGYHSNGMIFRHNTTESWRLNGARIIA